MRFMNSKGGNNISFFSFLDSKIFAEDVCVLTERAMIEYVVLFFVSCMWMKGFS